MTEWNFYTSKEIKPQGWLRRQLEIQAAGLGGNLDKVWRDVRDSAWIGGDAEGWERVPYWLDGFIPLAYLLEDADMIARARRYVDAILARQTESGWICPCDEADAATYDTWALQLISKVLVVYYECSGDERIPEVLYRAMRNYFDLLASGTVRLFDWGKYRWFEAFVAIRFLDKRYHEPWIAALAKLLREQGVNYGSLTGLWKQPRNAWSYDTHIVNLVMMLKQEALSCGVLDEEQMGLAERLHTVLRSYNGTAVGLFTGDECLSGLSAIQGTELCAVAEQMYSYEWLYAVTGDPVWAERLELLAFNALPATLSDDMWAHQYVQQSNQIACRKFPVHALFRTNSSDAHLFGLEPNFGCCTANMNQAWPKFALSAFLHRGDTVLSAVPVPSSLRTEELSVTLHTQYPFENRLEYVAEGKRDFTLCVRIPSFAKKLTVNGSPAVVGEDRLLTFAVPAGDCTRVELAFETEAELIDRPHDLKSARCGSLVFSLPIAYEKQRKEYESNGVERKYPYCDYEYLPRSEWNYAYSSPFLSCERRAVSETPFSSEQPPVVLKAEMQKIAWGLAEGYDSVCAKVPESRLPLSETETVTLYPYGCAKLRMTEMPLI